MRVTLDVSKLSGWLNDVADCRVERRAHDARGKVRAATREGGGRPPAQAACMGEGPDLGAVHPSYISSAPET